MLVNVTSVFINPNILSYKIFHGLYQRLCGCCDSGCRFLWKSGMTNDQKMMQQNMSMPADNTIIDIPRLTMTQTSSSHATPKDNGASRIESEIEPSPNGSKLHLTELEMVQSASDGSTVNTPNIQEV